MKLGRTVAITLLFAAVAAVYFIQKDIDRESASVVPDEVNRGFSLNDSERVVRIEISDRKADSRITLELLDGKWTILSPVRYLADADAAGGLAASLRLAAKQTRVRAEKDMKEYGFEAPQLEVTMVTDKKKKETLEFGNVSPVGRAVYARWASERGYILLPLEVRSVFECSLYTLIEKRIFREAFENIRKVTIGMGAHDYQWKKENGKWYWLEPVPKFGKELPGSRMEAILGSLWALHIKEFVEGDTRTPAEFGFYVIHDKITLEGKAGAEETLFFGNELLPQNAYYGMKSGEKKVFLVDRVKVFQLLDVLREVENESDAREGVPKKVMAQGSEEAKS
jgi:hypothetical protein